jgi:putrescine aminotransferase
MTATAERRAKVAAAYRRHFGRGRARIAKIFGERVELAASGSVVETDDGRFLDCAGLGVFLLGHGHPHVVEAVERQLHRHPLSTRMLLDPIVADAAQELARVAPDGLDHVHFVSSGTEAVETGIKLGRLQGTRRIVAMEGGFHGKTLGALSAMGRAHYRDPFRPLLPASLVPFGDAAALASTLAEGPRACVVLEPIQGEGGVNVPPAGYLQAVSQACRRHDAILVLDEIQTGLGRIGAWWAADVEGVVPDVLLTGKSLSGGVVPVAAALATAATYEPLAQDPLLHTSTFGGAPLAAAAARAAIETIERDDLVTRSRVLGERIRSHLSALAAGHPDVVHDVRGAGLLIGVELASPGAAGELMLQLLGHRILVNCPFNDARSIRLTPPAVLTENEVAWLLDGLGQSIETVAQLTEHGGLR